MHWLLILMCQSFLLSSEDFCMISCIQMPLSLHQMFLWNHVLFLQAEYLSSILQQQHTMLLVIHVAKMACIVNTSEQQNHGKGDLLDMTVSLSTLILNLKGCVVLMLVVLIFFFHLTFMVSNILVPLCTGLPKLVMNQMKTLACGLWSQRMM